MTVLAIPMADTISKKQRSYVMSRIRSVDTGPEMIVRRALHSKGYRYRLHDRRLPGSPDIVMPCRKTAIFVHGCFWHRHRGCRAGRTPKSNVPFWIKKLNRNVKRDLDAVRRLRGMGWSVKVLWECQLKKGAVEGLLMALSRRYV